MVSENCTMTMEIDGYLLILFFLNMIGLVYSLIRAMEMGDDGSVWFGVLVGLVVMSLLVRRIRFDCV